MRALAPLTALLLLLVLAASAAAQTPPPEPRIAAGVKAGGLDVGNLTIGRGRGQAPADLRAAALQPASRSISRGRIFRLTPKQSKLKFDTILTAKRAYNAGRTNPAADVPLATSASKARIRTFARSVARAVYRQPRDATIRITLRHIFRRKSVPGHSLDVKALRATITAALASGTAPHVIRPPYKLTKARVETQDLARAYGTVITIDRAHFKLRLFKRLKFSKSYGVAVGQPAYPTPTGRFQISDKQVNPAWTAPNSPWAGELAGTTTPGGSAANPLRPAGWGSPTASASTGPRRSTRSAAARRTAASACASRT